MLLSLPWLMEVIDLPWSDDELAERLIQLGIGVEKYSGSVFNLEITPNRGDLLSIIGIAREMAALKGSQINLPEAPALPDLPAGIKVTFDSSLVPRYTAAVVEKVKIAPTTDPLIIERLRESGMRPVNNVVDLTNYVMLLTGQPTHAFDADKIAGQVMKIRRARPGETLVTLDGVKRNLTPRAMVIADAAKVIDLPGVMGGENSEVDADSRRLLLQAAVFDPRAIRLTSKAAKVSSEASYRYERGVDAAATPAALARLCQMITETAGGEITGITDKVAPAPRRLIELVPDRVSQLLGTPVPRDETRAILKRLGCQVNPTPTRLLVTPPSWRHDLNLAEDLIEEVARLKGYNGLVRRQLPKRAAASSAEWELKESLKEKLAGEGLSEVMTYSLLSAREIEAAGFKTSQAVKISNPLSRELEYFRSGLLPGLLKAAAKNQAVDPLRVFEIGHVARGSKEFVEVGLLFAGRDAGQISALAGAIGLKSERINQTILNAFKIRKTDVRAARGAWDKISIKATSPLSLPQRVTVKPLSKFPSVKRDVSFIVDETVRNDVIKMAIAGVSEYIHHVELFDEFTGGKIGPGKKSLAFHLTYQRPDKTLTSGEINSLHQQVTQKLQQQFKANLR